MRKGVEYAIKHLRMLEDYFMVDVLKCGAGPKVSCTTLLNLGY